MNTGFLSNPKPSDGYDAVLAALAPHAAPAEGTLGGTAPTVHNRVKQTFINPVATYPFICRAWRDHWELGFHPGDLMFIYSPGPGDAANGDRPVVTQNRAILANLPTLNHILRIAHTPIDGNPTNRYIEYSKFRHMKDWAFIGVMRNSAAASGQRPSDKGGTRRGGNALAPERIINVDVRGATRMFNYWEHARAGEHLWLVWRQLKMDARVMDSMDSLGRSRDANLGTKRRRAVYEVGDPVIYHATEAEVATGIPRRNEAYVTKVHEDGTFDILLAGVDGDGRMVYTADNRLTRDRLATDTPLVTRMARECWQLLPYVDGDRTKADGSVVSINYQPLRVWWSDSIVSSRRYKLPICVGWVFQGPGAGERSDDAAAIRRATQMCEDRFRLPMIHTFLHV